MQNSYKLTRTRRHVVGMSCGSRNISQNSYKYRINSYRIARVYLYFVMNIVDMSYGTRRTVLTKTLVTQLWDICGDMWRAITALTRCISWANSWQWDRGLKRLDLQI